MVALSEIRYVSDLGPHTKEAQFSFKKVTSVQKSIFDLLLLSLYVCPPGVICQMYDDDAVNHVQKINNRLHCSY